MKKRSNLAFILIALATLAQAAPGKPNILFLFADDQMWNSLGSIEGCEVKTPNLDRLRERGVSFSHAYNQGSFSAGVCVASRTSINTGSFLWRAATFSRQRNEMDPNIPKHAVPYHLETKVTSARRPAGTVKKPKPILTEPVDLPSLAEYMGQADLETVGSIRK